MKNYKVFTPAGSYLATWEDAREARRLYGFFYRRIDTKKEENGS